MEKKNLLRNSILPAWMKDSQATRGLAFESTFALTQEECKQTPTPIYVAKQNEKVYTALKTADNRLNGVETTFLTFVYSYSDRPNPFDTLFDNPRLLLEGAPANSRLQIMKSNPVKITNNIAVVEYPDVVNKRGKYLAFAIWVDLNNDKQIAWEETYHNMCLSQIKVE